MSKLSVRLPDSLHKRLKDLAKQEGVSVNQLISTAVAEKVSALLTEDYLSYLRERAARGSWEKFDAAMSLVPDADPADRLP
ncbi:YlcI/YnfO family protein [Deinococcus planocerae]|uniref:YlcI/YnfO family protein n=1 Tax=Deinococcus planocerae TaxID=1737569 RepID=UPI000C7EE259|nr:YlcI/YnfO family protein [Deinococcus planocerae]